MSDKKNEREHVTVEVIYVRLTRDYVLYMRVPGGFVSVIITEDEAEKVSRIMGIEIDKKSFL